MFKAAIYPYKKQNNMTIDFNDHKYYVFSGVINRRRLQNWDMRMKKIYIFYKTNKQFANQNH